VRIYPIGYGSNLIGFDSPDEDTFFVRLSRNGYFSSCVQNEKSGLFRCGAMASVLELTRFSLERGYGGLSDLCGIPGSIGGMIRMNAGARGKCIADFLRSFTVLDLSSGIISEGDVKEFRFSYRDSGIPEDLVILSAVFELVPVDMSLEKQKIYVELHRRTKSPRGRSSGSIFKNPSDIVTAGQLLDSAGVKNMRIGNFYVSPEHANWIINSNENAKESSEKNFCELLDEMRVAVYEKFKILLIPEVRFISKNTEFMMQQKPNRILKLENQT